MNRWLTAFILLLLISNSQAKLVINEIEPLPSFTETVLSKIIIFPFNARALVGQKIDHLFISSRFQRDLSDSFLETTSIAPISEMTVSQDNGIVTRTIQGDNNIQDYNQLSEKNKKNINPASSGLAQAYMTGIIEEFIPSKNNDNSYIKLTFQLIDSRTKSVLWTSSISGCYSFVIRTITGTIANRQYTGPSARDESEYDWKNPQTNRIKTFAIGMDFHSLVPLGSLKNSIRPAMQMSVASYFTTPFIPIIVNKVSIGFSKHYPNINDGSDYYFIPISLSFLYDIPVIPANVKNFYVSGNADLGVHYQLIRFSRVLLRKDDIHSVGIQPALGIDLRYEFPSVTAYMRKIFIYWPKTAIHLGYQIDLFQFKDSSGKSGWAPNSNLSLGLKIHI